MQSPPIPRRLKPAFALALAAGLSLGATACAHRPPRQDGAERPAPWLPQSQPGAAPGQVETTDQANRDGLRGAAKAPLRDLNMIRTKIPPVLLTALADPYERPGRLTCQALADRTVPLDEALGADLDTPSAANDGHLIEKGKEAAGDLAVDAVRSTAEGLIPMRSWVRKLTGAERHDRLVAAAIIAGGIRRGYLKGLGEGRGCEAPAPIHLEGPPPVIEDHRSGPRFPIRLPPTTPPEG